MSNPKKLSQPLTFDQWLESENRKPSDRLRIDLKAAFKAGKANEILRTQAIKDVISERQRQRDQGRDDAHDDGYIDGVLALGGAAYAISGAGFNCVGTYRRRAKNLWPFPLETFNPAGNANRRADLVRAAAMIIAEIDKIDRRTARTACEGAGKKRFKGNANA
ncbi:MAG: hypothetical protein ACTIOQ_15100 [Serratia grimesii]|uniref:hypothetical protein n=1 Tax=Serratia grimesii TaxID=82995 RepID=UPI003F98244C